VVSSYAGVFVRGVEIFTWRNEIDPTFLFLFTNQDVHRVPRNSDNEYDPEEIVHLTAKASALQDRLDVLGIGREALESAFKAAVEYRLKISRGTVQIINLRQDRVALLEKITLSSWAELLASAIEVSRKRGRNDIRNPTSVASLLEIWEDADPRFLVGAVLLSCAPDDEITLDVSELIEGGWIDNDFDPQRAAIDHFSYSLANGSPPVVITEGSTDAQFLRSALRIRYPHLRSYIKFFDFADGAEGSAAAGIRTLKSFAAAGISNRVVLLLDNDTAARDALRALRGTTLPSHYSILQYPDIDLARSYPTQGPNSALLGVLLGLFGPVV
jgi:HEPN superfamily Toprim-like protein